MLVPYFGPAIEKPEVGELRKSKSFFDAGIRFSYDIKVADNARVQLNAGGEKTFSTVIKKTLIREWSRSGLYVRPAYAAKHLLWAKNWKSVLDISFI